MDFSIGEKLLAVVNTFAHGADAIVHLDDGRSTSLRFASNEITTAVDRDAGNVSLEVAIGKRHAKATTTRTDAESLAALADRAISMAKLAPENPEWMGVLGAQTIKPVPGAHDPAAARLDADARAKAARGAIEHCEKRGAIGAGFFENHDRKNRIVTSAGLSVEHAFTEVSFTMTARTPDGTGSGWAGGSETRAADLDAASIAARAVDKGLRSAKPQALPAGKYTVILEPDAVGDLLSFLIGAMGAREADEGRSFFTKNGVGAKLFPKEIALRSDPSDPLTPGSPFDGEGIPLAPMTWIDEGTVRALHYSRFWANKQGKKPTGSYGTYQLTGGKADSIEALVSKVDKGLLVTRFWYTRWLDPRSLLVTGLTRDGVLMIEKGKITHPVNNFRFNESPRAMLAKCVDMTKQTYRVASGWYDVLRVPAILTSEFEMSSVSAAV
jgi:predicted Zn-dependent protease